MPMHSLCGPADVAQWCGSWVAFLRSSAISPVPLSKLTKKKKKDKNPVQLYKMNVHASWNSYICFNCAKRACKEITNIFHFSSFGKPVSKLFRLFTSPIEMCGHFQLLFSTVSNLLMNFISNWRSDTSDKERMAITVWVDIPYYIES